ncbi:hypothetical protein [Mycobacterium sp. 1245805.9]|uniref:hypothetical protein n=1 Tax=Mycobacterium sp. 1245805.9 TaxID=1856862 RepID=UPI0009EF6B3F
MASSALNLRDSGLAVDVFARADASREQAEADGFQPGEIEAASAGDVICTLIPESRAAAVRAAEPRGRLLRERSARPPGRAEPPFRNPLAGKSEFCARDFLPPG